VDLSSSRHHLSGHFEPVSVREDAKDCALLLTFVTGSNIYSALIPQRELSERICAICSHARMGASQLTIDSGIRDICQQWAKRNRLLLTLLRCCCMLRAQMCTSSRLSAMSV